MLAKVGMAPLPIFASVCLVAFLLAVTLIDLRTQRIPDGLNLAMGVTGLGFASALRQPLGDHVIGAVCGFAALYLLNEAYRHLRGRDGIGMGDAKFMAAAGLWLGWIALPFVALIAASAALSMLSIAALMGRPVRPDTRIAFGPFLALGVAVAWIVLLARGGFAGP